MIRSFKTISVAQVQAFVTVAESGGFGKAAERLERSQPSISRNVKEVEDALGSVLFDRQYHGAILSPQGKAVLPLAERLLQLHAEAQASISEWKSSSRRVVKIVGSVSVVRVVMPSLLRRVQAESQGLQIRASEGLSGEVVRQIRDGESTLGICAGEEGHTALRYTPVLEAQFGLLVPQAFQAAGNLESLSTLNAMTMIRVCDQSSGAKLLRRHCPGLAAYFNSPVVVDHMQAAVDLVQRFGYVTLATGLAASHAAARGLRFIELPCLLPQTRVYVISRRDDLFNKSNELLRAKLIECIHDSPWHPSVRRLSFFGAAA